MLFLPALRRFVFCALSAATLLSEGLSQVLTIQVGAPAPPPAALVNSADTWHYRKGTSEPQADWKTAGDASLDGTWFTGPGGFGYGDSDDATVLDDMLNSYNTVYIRRSFEIPPGTDASRRVQLVMDWDDGFVAYLDGVEVARSPNVGVASPLFDSQTVAGQNHEASAGAGGSPPTSYDLGPVGALLVEGTHVLTVHGLNSDLASSDFSLIADLRLVGGASVAGGGALFAIVNSANTPLSGTNTLPGATRVTVNGEEAAFNPVTGQWALNKTLQVGLNKLFVAALTPDGTLLASTNRDVLFNQSVVGMGGDVVAPPLNAVAWAFGPSTVLVTNTVTVKSGTYLLISNTVAVLFAPGASLKVEPGATLIVKDDGFSAHGGRPIFFGPADGATPWGELSANGGLLWLNDCEVVSGQIIGTSNATVTLENCLLRDFRSGTRLFLAATNAASFAVRGCQIARYEQARFSGTPVLIEDCLIEQIFSDATDFADSPEIVVRNTTYRYGSGANTDAIDLGENPGTLIEGVLIHGFPDKGVSIAGESHGTVVRNSLIFGNGFGISAYASSNCVFANNTIAACTSGIALWERNAGQGAGHAFGTNLIVWGNATNVHLANGGSLDAAYCDIGETVWSGTGNINNDPQFVNAAGGDYRIASGSPASGTGQDGVDMGPILPVGGLPPEPFNLMARVSGTGPIQILWQEDAVNETGFVLERSTDGVGWSPIAMPAPGMGGLTQNVTSHTDSNAELNQRYFYRVQAVGNSGASRFSNVAGAIRQEPNIFAGGTLAGDTTWSPALGTITVLSNLFVPSGVTLTVLPGTIIKLTNLTSIIAAGGVIDIAGTAENKVHLMPMEGTNIWGQLSAQFPGASLTVSHADIAYGQVTVYSNAVGLIEDSYIHDYRRAGGTLFTTPIILSHFPASIIVRRCHIREYHETLFRHGQNLIEDCLFELMVGDAVDFDAAVAGSIIRRCTFRHGNRSNADAVDIGNDGANVSFATLISDCLMFDFPFDKGISIGEAAQNIVVSNCLMHHCLWGIGVKDSSTVGLYNNTISTCDVGFRLYNKNAGTGSGIVTNSFNNVLWGNTNSNLLVLDGGSITVNYSDVGDTDWPGTGNLNADPLFANALLNDYRLSAGSPCLGTGRNGEDMGAHFPVGAPMALSHPRIEAIDAGGADVVVRFWADNEKTYSLLSSPVIDGVAWTKVADVGTAILPRFLSVTNTIAPGNQFYRLVTPAVP